MHDDAQAILERFPHLISPAHLGEATNPDWKTPRHLAINNEWLLRLAYGEIKRLMVNLPYQHGKSELNSRLFPAWYLLLHPHHRVMIVGHKEEFAATEYGLPIKDIFNQWGSDLGLEIREDQKAKGTWGIEGHKGKLVCRGWRGDLTGRPAELIIIDDLIKSAEEALSETTLEAHWRFYQTVIFARRRAITKLLLVGTRWTKNDLFGRLIRQAARTGEAWHHLKFAALARENDLLGRKVGEPLWPEQVPLEQLRIAEQEFGKWFSAGWQQEPEDEEGAHFKPSTWPLYSDLGFAYSIPLSSGSRRLIPYEDVLRYSVADWGMSSKRKSNFTAIGTFGLLPTGELLLLYVRVEKVKLENVVNLLAEECRTWRPSFVLAEAEGFQAALLMECRRYSEIPEVRPVTTRSQAKIVRAMPAIVMGQNGRILLPDLAVSSVPRTTAAESGLEWLERYKSRLAGFTGIGDEKDDEVDVTAYAAQFAYILKGSRGNPDTDAVPCLLTPGKQW